MVGSNLHRFYEGRYIIVDLEAESLTLRFNRPWQCSWAIADNKKIHEIKNRYVLWDNLNVSTDAARLTKFNRLEYTRLAKPAEEVLSELEIDLYNTSLKIVGQNLFNFDLYIINYWRELMGRSLDDSFKYRILDTNCLSKAYIKGIKPDTSNLYRWQYKMTNLIERGLKTNQEHMCKTFGISCNPNMLHKSDYDIKINYEIYKQLLNKVEF